MNTIGSRTRTTAYLDRLVEDAVSGRRLPAEVATFAARKTFQKAAASGAHWSTRRLRNYFEAVAARRLIRCRAGDDATARVVARSVVADLMAGGRSKMSAFTELERGWGDRMPPELLEEFRVMLSA